MQALMARSEEITETVLSWPGVTAGVGRRGEWAFKLGGRELGHLHGDHVAHLPFPKSVWNELYAAGRITEHPIFPGSGGWAARHIVRAEDVVEVIALLQMNFDRAIRAQGKRS